MVVGEGDDGHGGVCPSYDFFHKQLATVAHKRYMTRRDHAVHLHSQLAAFYLALADPTGDRTWASNNARAFSELPYHLLRSGQQQQLEELLCDLVFIRRKCSLGMTFDLVGDMYAALESTSSQAQSSSLFSDDEQATASRLESFYRFMTANAHVLSQHAELTLQQAANQPDSSAPAVAARELWARGAPDAVSGAVSAWVRWINKPQTQDACVLTLSGYSDAMMACAFSPDGSRMVCASRDRTLKVWDARSGAEVATLVGHSNWVVACAYSPDGSKIVSASWDETLKVWDAELGTEIRTLKGHSRRVSACAFSSDGRFVVSGS